jgi:hypothetical protein
MSRLVWPALVAALSAICACGSSDDDRPRDAQYITDTILAPQCGGAECHSTFAQSNGIVLDTYEGMRTTMVYGGLHGNLLSFASDQYDPSAPQLSSLITWLTQIDPFMYGVGRMPLDEAMPNADIDLLEAWISGPVTSVDDDATCIPGVTACPQVTDTCVVKNGATMGECEQVTFSDPAHGAACDPGQFAELACNGILLVKCTSDWSFGETVQACDNDCVETPASDSTPASASCN